MSCHVKIPKGYRIVVGNIAGLETGHALEMDGKSYQAIAHILHPYVTMRRGLVLKKKDFSFDGTFISD